jgi:CRP-like cAMP-binding protein
MKLMNAEIDQIRGLHLFAALSDQQFETLVAKSKVIQLEKSETLFRIDDKAAAFFVLIDGSIKVAIDSPQGVEKVLTIVRPLDLFAEAVMFLEKPCYPVNAIALQPSKVISFDSNLLISMLRNSPDVSLKMLSLLSARLHNHINEIETLTSQNSTSRVLNYLGSLITTKADNKATLLLEISKKNLASRLSITPETLSRVLHKLMEHNIIELDGKHIVVPDIAKYRKYLLEL